MGQRDNILTIRKPSFFFNISNQNNKIFSLNFKLLKIFKKILIKKNIIVTKAFLNISWGKVFLYCNLFFRTRKIQRYQKRNKKKYNLKQNLAIFKLFKILKRKYKMTSVVSDFCIINHFLNKRFYFFLFKKFKMYNNTKLFDKKPNLFLDFLKLINLYCFGEVNIETFCLILAQIFKFLQKRQHAKFFALIRTLVNLITNKFIQNKYKTKNIVGIKILINGRLKGKDKKSKICIKNGVVPIQSFNRRVNFSKTIIFNMRHGVFGIRAWDYKS